jgi:hypothetical protein
VELGRGEKYLVKIPWKIPLKADFTPRIKMNDEEMQNFPSSHTMVQNTIVTIRRKRARKNHSPKGDNLSSISSNTILVSLKDKRNAAAEAKSIIYFSLDLGDLKFENLAFGSVTSGSKTIQRSTSILSNSSNNAMESV